MLFLNDLQGTKLGDVSWPECQDDVIHLSMLFRLLFCLTTGTLFQFMSVGSRATITSKCLKNTRDVSVMNFA